MSGIEGYCEFLKRRDGIPDIYRDRLSQREIFFEKIERARLRKLERAEAKAQEPVLAEAAAPLEHVS